METLKAMFPTVDEEVAQSILDDEHGNVENAVQKLLALTDPEAQAREAVRTPTAPQGVVSEDERLARALADEDYARHLQESEQHHPQRGPMDEGETPILDKIEAGALVAGDAVKKGFLAALAGGKELYTKIKAEASKHGVNMPAVGGASRPGQGWGESTQAEEPPLVRKGDMTPPALPHRDDEPAAAPVVAASASPPPPAPAKAASQTVVPAAVAKPPPAAVSPVVAKAAASTPVVAATAPTPVAKSVPAATAAPVSAPTTTTAAKKVVDPFETL
ncbi:hypothetical protein SmJEL517_g00117 [Synchytrium microbalum]|uniref:CUE domain-containing protein n=1 Tax=Synchytrium microbalum TaxID=1806994 RepID=A0A507C9S1_9FUNG|nr:uncharacterized protein SmJEL517_g00117 [Synchytrium microbalum]TPX38330.1 hypothetical protein SmJEL517_g00117 [Synchytrium microbalum]